MRRCPTMQTHCYPNRNRSNQQDHTKYIQIIGILFLELLLTGCVAGVGSVTHPATQPQGQMQQPSVSASEEASIETTEQVETDTPLEAPLVPSLSPGIYALTASTDGFYIYSIDGDEIGLIPFEINGRADISSDGKFLAFDNPGLGILNLFTEETITLEKLPPGLDPSWSPDNDQLVVISSEDPHDFGSIFIFGLEEYLTQRITFSPGLESDPVWSPDGMWIAYVSDEESELVGDTELYIIDASCIDINNCQYANKRLEPLSGRDWASQPSWSPDSQKIVYTCGGGIEGLDLCIYDMSSLSTQMIVDHPGDDMSPHWSPDGNWIGFTRQDNKTFVNRAYIIKTSGEEERLISETDRDESFTSWLVIE